MVTNVFPSVKLGKAELLVQMRRLFNFVNVYTKSFKCLLNIYMNKVGNNKKQIIFSNDNSITVTASSATCDVGSAAFNKD